MTALDAVADQFPVEAWRASGLGVWPLYRYELATTNHYLLNRAVPAPRTWLHKVARAGPLVGTLRSSVVDRPHNDTLLRQRDILFYSDGVSFSRLGGAYFEKFCDPLIERLATEFGLESVLLTPLHAGLTPRFRKSVLVQPQIDAALIASKAAARIARGEVQLEGIEPAGALVRRLLPGAQLPSPQRLVRNAEISHQLSRLCEVWLRLVRPRVVFVVAYYGNERAAMVLACRRLGIPCVDIQHGAVSDVHFAYARLGRIPPGGYELLPKWFWVWSDEDRGRIEQWATASDGAHCAITGGNPFITFCRESSAHDLVELRHELDRVIGQMVRRENVLFTANGYESSSDLEMLATVISETANTHRWWVRMHPARLEAARRFEAALERQPEARTLVSLATRVPLPLLLTHMQAHVTEGSSAADEAALFGVPTVLFAEEGRTQFGSLISKGLAVAVDDLKLVPASLLALSARGRPSPANGGSIERAALATLVRAPS